MSDHRSTGTQQVRIWDVWVRLFHWSLAVSVGFLLLSGETGWQFFEWHRQVGEIALALVVFRIVWGFVGSDNAGLLSLVRSPMAALVHLRELLSRTSHAHRGHNPAGGWAVLALLLSVAVQGITGLFIADEDEFIEGAFYGAVSSDLSDNLYRLHHLNAELLTIVVVVHIVMVFAYLLLARQNLIRPMITGMMAWPHNQPIPDNRFAPAWRGFIIAAIIAAGLWYFL